MLSQQKQSKYMDEVLIFTASPVLPDADAATMAPDGSIGTTKHLSLLWAGGLGDPVGKDVLGTL